MEQSIVNSQIDHYYIKRRIKAGGVAVVYEAMDTNNDGEIVALKLLQTNWAQHEEVIYRFEREARIMHQLKHPHIVEFRDFGMINGRPYIVMEYMPGGSLAEGLKKVQQINLGSSAKLLAQIANALDYAHAKNIVHRDLKPGNILLRDKSHAVLTDFGIARVLEQTMLTLTGNMPGTPHYMSPEQARGATELDPLSDQYSFAVIAYLLTTGGLPFKGTDPIVIINQHLSGQPPLPSRVNPDLPKELDGVLLKALAKNPADRFSAITEFSEAFLEATDGHRKLNVMLASRRNNPVELAQSVIDAESRVFSSAAALPSTGAAKSPLDWSEQKSSGARQIQRRRPNPVLLRLGAVIIASIIMAFIAYLLGRSTSENGTSDPVKTQAAVIDEAIQTTAVTLTPYAPDFDEFIAILADDLGTPSSFNCELFILSYNYLEKRVDEEDEAFGPARDLIKDSDSPMSLIYEDHCKRAADETDVFISSMLFSNLRTELNRFR